MVLLSSSLPLVPRFLITENLHRAKHKLCRSGALSSKNVFWAWKIYIWNGLGFFFPPVNRSIIWTPGTIALKLLKPTFKIYFYCVWLCVCVCVHMDMFTRVQVLTVARDVRSPGAGVTGRVDHLTLMLGTELWHSARALSAPKHWSVFPTLRKEKKKAIQRNTSSQIMLRTRRRI